MGLLHGVKRRPEGGLRVALSLQERDALRALPDTLRPVLSGEDAGEPTRRVRERMFPPAYEDPELDREFRSMVHDDLVERRQRALEGFLASLDGGRRTGWSWTVELDEDGAELWLSVVNDARLALGTLLGVTSEDHWMQGPQRDNAASVLLWYLGWLEERMVEAMMGSLPDMEP